MGNPIYDTTKELAGALHQGLITEQQFDAARARIMEGYQGIDPLGFDKNVVKDQVGGMPAQEEAAETPAEEAAEQAAAKQL